MMMRYAIRSRRAVQGVGALAASAALASAGLLLPATPAQAADVDLICEASAAGNFSPPLSPSNTSSIVTVTRAALTGCSSPNGKFSQLKSANVTGSGPANASGPFLDQCAVLLKTTVNGTITWQNHDESGLTFTLNSNITKGTVQLSGKVTSGPLTGDTIRALLVPTLNLDCATAGTKSIMAEGGPVSFN